jgi:hypothetical protein
MSTTRIVLLFFDYISTLKTQNPVIQQFKNIKSVSRTLQKSRSFDFWHKIKACILRLWIRNIFITKDSSFESTKKVKKNVYLKIERL